MNIRNCFWSFVFGLILISGQVVVAQETSWIGQTVFYKEGAVAKVGEKEVSIELIEFPALVKEEKGEWLWVGRAWLRKSDCMLEDEAMAHYNEVLRKNPKSIDALRRRASCWAVKADQAKAFADLDEAVRLEPKNARSLHERGKIKVEFAIANQIGKVVEKSLGNAADGIVGGLGVINGILGGAPIPGKEEKKSEEVIDAAGLTKEDRALLEDGIRDLDAAIVLDPKLANAYIDRSLAKGQMMDLQGAVKDLDEALKLDNQNEAAFSYRAAAKMELDDLPGAILDLDEAIKLDPKSTFNLRDRGSAKEALKDFAGAVADFEQVLRLDPEDGFAMHDRGQAKVGLKDYAGALRDYDEALRMGAATHVVTVSKVFLLATAPEGTVRNPEEALKLAESLLPGDPPQGDALSAKACALAATGKFAEAIELEKSASQDKIWTKDESIVGGAHSEARIAAWKAEKQWQP